MNVYFREANAVFAGKIPQVDIPTAYGFLFDYISAAIVLLWHSPKAIILFSIAMELTSFPIWLAVSRLGFVEAAVRRAAILYIFNPLAVSTVVLAGQNHVWISLFLGLSLLHIGRQQAVRSGAWLGLSVVAVKFLGLLFAPILFLLARKRLAWIVSFLILPAIGGIVPLMFGAQPWKQILFHGLYNSSGSIPYLLGAVGLDLSGVDARAAADVAAFAILCAAFVLAVRRLGVITLARGILMCAFVLVIVLLVQKKSFTTYLVIALFPLCTAIALQKARHATVLFMQAFSVLATLEPSLWFRWMHQHELNILFAPHLPDNLDRAQIVVFAACETALIASYAAILLLLWRAMARLPAPADAVLPSEDFAVAMVPRTERS